MAMGLLRLLPPDLRTKLILKGLLEVLNQVDATQLGTQINQVLDARYGANAMAPIQAKVAEKLERLAAALKA